MSRAKFVELTQSGILSLGQDLKSMLRIADDPEIDDESRVAAAGALLHFLSAANAIPGLRGKLGFVDDVLVIRLVLELIKKRSPEALAAHEADEPGLLEPLDEFLSATRAYLGNLVQVLERAAAAVPKLQHEGHTALECARDTEASTWLYGEIQSALVDLDFDEDEVARAMKNIDEIVPQLKLRMSAKS